MNYCVKITEAAHAVGTHTVLEVLPMAAMLAAIFGKKIAHIILLFKFNLQLTVSKANGKQLQLTVREANDTSVEVSSSLIYDIFKRL